MILEFLNSLGIEVKETFHEPLEFGLDYTIDVNQVREKIQALGMKEVKKRI